MGTRSSLRRSPGRGLVRAVVAAACGVALLAACEPAPPPNGSDLGVAMSDEAAAVGIDGTVHRSAVVTNHGSAPSVGARVAFLVPDALDAQLHGDRLGECTGAVPFGDSGLLAGSCVLGDVAAGESFPVELRLRGLRPMAESQVHLLVSSPVEPRPDVAANTAAFPMRVSSGYELMFNDPGPVPVGTTFQVTGTINGPSPVVEYLTISVPPNLHLDGVEGYAPFPTEPACEGTGVVSCYQYTSAPVVMTLTALDVGGPSDVVFSGSSEAGYAYGTARVLVVDPSVTSDVSVALDPVELAAAGEPFELTGRVRTGGPVAHEQVEVAFSVPSGLTVVDAAWGAPHVDVPCAISGRSVTCAIGPMAGYRTHGLSLTLVPTAPTPSVTISASVTSATAQDDPDPGPDAAGTTFAVEERFNDLGVTDLVLGDDPFIEGTTSTVTLDVRNFGTVDATGVTLTAVVPELVVPLRGDLPQPAPAATRYCGRAGQTMTCDIGTLEPGESQFVRLHYRADAPTSGHLQLTVASDQSEPGPDPHPNVVTVPIIAMGPQTDLGISFPDAPAPVVVGEERVITAEVENLNGSREFSSDVTLTIPDGWTIVAPEPFLPCVVSGQSMTCTQEWGLDEGRTYTVRVTVVPNVVLAGAEIHAVVEGELPDPDLSSNEATTTIDSVGVEADLGLVVDAPDLLPETPASRSMSVRVTNHGPAEATNVVVTGTFPSSVSVSSAPSACVVDGSTVTCTFASLHPGQARFLDFSLRYGDVSSPVSHHFTVVSDQPEPAAQVGDHDVTTVVGTGGRISGAVAWPDGSPAAGVTVQLFSLVDTFFPSRGATTGADGIYSIGAITPGSYRVSFRPPSTSGLPREWFDDQSNRADGTLLVVTEAGEVYVADAELGP